MLPTVAARIVVTLTDAQTSLPIDGGENELFSWTTTVTAPRSRIDYYTCWNYRRRREGSSRADQCHG